MQTVCADLYRSRLTVTAPRQGLRVVLLLSTALTCPDLSPALAFPWGRRRKGGAPGVRDGFREMSRGDRPLLLPTA
jgi:hypothetical protein